MPLPFTNASAVTDALPVPPDATPMGVDAVTVVAATVLGVTEPIGGGAVSAEVISADVISPVVSAAPTLDCLTMKLVPPVPDRLAPAPPDATPIGVDAVTVVNAPLDGVTEPIAVGVVSAEAISAERMTPDVRTAPADSCLTICSAPPVALLSTPVPPKLTATGLSKLMVTVSPTLASLDRPTPPAMVSVSPFEIV